jgi:hypothetical protein
MKNDVKNRRHVLEKIIKKKRAVRKTKNITMKRNEYDLFLKIVKKGRYRRVGRWKGFRKNVTHKCLDPMCGRVWKPPPSDSLKEEYHCPSCVLSYHNNVDRFSEDRLKWTADVPNTFYVYLLSDPQENLEMIKFGRTKNVDPNKRYPLKERKNYKMKLLFSLRGKLKKMIEIENWWKEEAKKQNAFIRFSEINFHGRCETIKNDPNLVERFIEQSKKMALN